LRRSAAIGGDRVVERCESDPLPIVGRHDVERRAAEAGEIHRLADAAMSGRRCIGDQPLAAGGDAAAPHGGTESVRAGNQDADEVGHRRAGDEEAGGGVRKAEELPHPLDDLALDLDRRVIAAAEICVKPGRQHFRQHASRVAAAMDPPHETGMGVADAEGEDVPHELVMHDGKVGRRGRNRLAKAVADCIGDRLPDRAVADVLKIIEDIVEHPVPLEAEALPIRGIERFLRKASGGFGRDACVHRRDRPACALILS
jgi:hypothetical protein